MCTKTKEWKREMKIRRKKRNKERNESQAREERERQTKRTYDGVLWVEEGIMVKDRPKMPLGRRSWGCKAQADQEETTIYPPITKHYIPRKTHKLVLIARVRF